MNNISVFDLVDDLRDTIDMLDDKSQTLVLAVASAQLAGEKVSSICVEELIDTLGCHRSGECECFGPMVSQLLDELSGEEVHTLVGEFTPVPALQKLLAHRVIDNPAEVKTTYAPIPNALKPFMLGGRG